MNSLKKPSLFNKLMSANGPLFEPIEHDSIAHVFDFILPSLQAQLAPYGKSVQVKMRHVGRKLFLSLRVMAGAGGGQFSVFGLPTPTVAIKADGTLWQDNTRTTPVTADGQSIGSADDSSGNGYNALQAGAGKPVFKANIFGSLPGMLFTAASSQYLQTAAFAAALSQPVTVLVSAKSISVTANRRLVDNSLTTLAILAQNLTQEWALVPQVNGPAVDTNPHVFAGLFNGALGASLYVDGGTAATTSTASAALWPALVIGANGSGSAPWNGYLLDILVLPYLATLSQLNAAGPLMAARAGTVWTTAV